MKTNFRIYASWPPNFRIVPTRLRAVIFAGLAPRYPKLNPFINNSTRPVPIHKIPFTAAVVRTYEGFLRSRGAVLRAHIHTSAGCGFFSVSAEGIRFVSVLNVLT